ncbi:hypothetical protein CAPTEDRAFT_223301 [Capitella teleta]|uniref:Major facilitator superfamily (MFS) profile domain-containing protein n=1 Tax=Capitella teleta TaxID=283909 RepID=R7VJR2_CAPTE|nr:hypothetical protein CAPTEDRAFT_223301 [Capitella teleta]|eukprot:ELU16691.1 hypothetical protein CAPTEDRAFT_223301 [Capitella teleta]
MSDSEDTKGLAKCEMKQAGEGDDCIVDDQDDPLSFGQLSKKQIFVLTISFFGINAMLLVLTVVVVPAQIESMVGSAYKGRWFGGIVAGGAVLQLLVGPLVGMYSDRMVCNYGRRRPVMLGAVIAACAGLLGMAASASTLTGAHLEIVQNMSATGNCTIDLEAHRCMPYENHTGIVLGQHTKHSAPIKRSSNYLEPETAGHVGAYAVFYLLMVSSVTAFLTPYSALLADKACADHRGRISGVMGCMTLLGMITGAVIGTFLAQMGVFAVFGLVISVFVATASLTIGLTSERPAKATHPPIDWKDVFVGFWEPLKEHDFRWVFITRFFMQQGISTTIGFLEYWMSDMIPLPFCWTPMRAVAITLVPMLIMASIASMVCGIVSDYYRRRKALIIGAALLMCITTLCIAFIRGPDGYFLVLALAFVFGAGLGSFQSVDFALVMDVLPAEKDKAKDLAVWNQALVLPQALATPIGGVLLDVFESVNCHIGLGYIILFIVTSAYFLLSGLFLLKIRGVR